MSDKLLTPEQAAERLNVSDWTIRAWLRSGRIKGVKIGKLWRISEDEIDAMIRGLDAAGEGPN